MLLLVCLQMNSYAQVHRAYTRPEPVWEFLLKGGWQYTSMADSGYDEEFRSGWNAGLGLKIPITGAWWLQPELLYSQRAAMLTYPQSAATAAYEATYTFSYVTYPLLVAYRPNDIFELQFGPQFGVLLSNTVQRSGNKQQNVLSTADLNKWEYGLAGGIELNVSPLAFGVRYAYGLHKIAQTVLARKQLGNGRLQGLQFYGALVF